MAAQNTPQPSPKTEETPHEAPLIVRQNVRVILAARRTLELSKSRQERIAHRITEFAGSMLFVYLNIVGIGSWLLVNWGVLPFLQPFDPFPFVMLAVLVSIEALFLATFVLISQNRMAAISEKRAELDLQINLLAEHEITRVLTIVDAIADHIGVAIPRDSAVDMLKKHVDPQTVLTEIEQANQESVEEATESLATAAAPESDVRARS